MISLYVKCILRQNGSIERGRGADSRVDTAMDDQTFLKGIQEVAADLGVTHRTLRYYEDQGLISPQRVGQTRVYSRRDVARMHLILRGKRLGFSIRDIRRFLDLYDADPARVEQMSLLLQQVRTRLSDLEKQRLALDETMTELREMERDAAAHLARLERG